MDQSRWKTVARIFHDALELPDNERAEYIVRASRGDAALQQEVESLLSADAAARDYIETPLVGSGTLRSLFQPTKAILTEGEILCERFRIIRSVGEGGMGQVFEAHDSELDVEVALKTIRPEIASNPGVLARFRQEVRLARRITHPNVCRTFDLERDAQVSDKSNGSRNEIVFLTMEFLKGESLSVRLRREGALPLDMALKVARQIASGLESAHALGVVHRDIKPGNIMLVPDEHGVRAVITDFGLAHVDGLEASHTLSGIAGTAPMGTLAYMAPEQLEGRGVSSATDIYAFGLILFEMITATQVFPPGALLSGIAQRVTGRPVEISKLAPHLPEYWKSAISACLAFKEESRPRPAEVVNALENETIVSASAESPGRTADRLRAWFTPKRLAVGALVIVTMALSWAGLRYLDLRRNPGVSPGALIYLVPVRNETGEKGLDDIGELIRAGLSQSTMINLLDSANVGDTLERMTRPPDTVIDQPIAREIAMRNGAVRVIFLKVRLSGGKYQLDVDVQQPDNTPTRYRKHWEKSFEWHTPVRKGAGMTIPSDLLTATRDASDWVRREIGESRNDVARLDSPPEDVTTGNWEALVVYEEALHLEALGQHDRAVEMLQSAVNLDPRFSLAFARLGDILVSIGRYREGFDAYTKALSIDALNRLTRRERDRIKGIYASDTEDYATAAAAFRDYSTYYENDYLGWFYQAFPLRMLGRDDESLYVLRRSLAVHPDSRAAEATLVDQLVIQGNFDEAQNQIRKLKDEGQLYEATWREGDIAFLSGNFREAEQDYRLLGNSSDRRLRGISIRMLARLHAEQGDAEGAIQILHSGIEDDLAHGDDSGRASKLLDIAYLDLRVGKNEDAVETVKSALDIDSAPESFLKAATVLGEAFLKASPATRGLIRTVLHDLEHRSAGTNYGLISERTRLRLHGEVLLAEGRTEEALIPFRQESALQAPADEREYLGRAYGRAAETAPDRAHASDWKARARDAFAKIAIRPRFAWSEALHYPPGFLGDQTWSYLQCAINAQPLDRNSADTLRFFSRIRPDQLRGDPGMMLAFAKLTSTLPQPSIKQGDQR